MEKKYLVTGGAGFIGSHLVETLLKLGNEVVIVDNLSTGRYSNIAHLSSNAKLRTIIASVLERDIIEREIRESDAVFHLASAVGVRLIMDHPVETIENIFNGTDVVLRYAARYRKKVILTSTSEVYGKSQAVPFREDGDRIEGPTSLHRWAYASAKALDEFLALAHHKTTGLPVVVLRLFNTVGPRQVSQYGMVLARFVEAALKGQTLYVHGDGRQTRCFCHVSDAVRGITAAMAHPKCDGEVINLGSAEEISIFELARKVVSQTESKSNIELVPYEKAFPGGGFEDMQRRVPSTEKAKALLNWRPELSLEEIIRDTVMFARQAAERTNSGAVC